MISFLLVFHTVLQILSLRNLKRLRSLRDPEHTAWESMMHALALTTSNLRNKYEMSGFTRTKDVMRTKNSSKRSAIADGPHEA